MRKSSIWIYSLFLLIGLIMISTLIPLPYYITMPGSAEKLRPIIKVKDGDKSEKGDFMLTSVGMMRATPFTYVLAKMKDFYEIEPMKEVIPKDTSEEQYEEQQLMMMDFSQQAAKVVAYKAAGKKVDYVQKGVVVVSVVKGMPADGVLKEGDRIVGINGHVVKTSEELIATVKNKKKGDKVLLQIVRGKNNETVEVGVAPFKDEPKRVGIGVSLATEQEVKVSPPVQIDTKDIGGPSAGLMFSLEMYSQLTEGDLTKGHEIAGTGTVNVDGVVGPIGGISQKIVAADKEGAEIFFAPNEKGDKNSNYREALKAAKKIKTKMKIIPVDTFQDALSYLETMK